MHWPRALVIAEREPLLVYDRVVSDRTGHRMTLEHDPFRNPDDLYTVLGELHWTEHVRASHAHLRRSPASRLRRASPRADDTQLTYTLAASIQDMGVDKGD